MNSLNIKLKYKTLQDDVVNDFYIPVLSRAKYYYRAVGYFSSSILLDYTKGLIKFIKNNGKIKLIISPYITEKDLKELKYSYDNPYENSLLDDLFSSFLNGNQKTIAASKLLIMLINSGIIEIKVAEPNDVRGLFHEKIGIFIDNIGNKIAIIGSNNETDSAVTINQESFNTFCSWKQGQTEYINEHISDFDKYWSGKNEYIKLISLKDALKENTLKLFNTNQTIDDLIAEIEDIPQTRSLSFSPYDYQRSAVDKWFLTKKGIFKFATGSGKTKTAIFLMEKIKQETRKKYFVVVVPDKTLVNQWSEELAEYSNHILKCFSDNSGWENKMRDVIDIFNLHDKRYQYFVVTNDTFFGAKFQKELKKINNDYLLIVDECHSWGTERILSNLPNTQMRLGLSATPELFFSETKTERLITYFGGIALEYSLENAIHDKKLVGYYYYPIFVNLTEKEIEAYDLLTQKIVKMIGSDVDEFSDHYNKALEMLLFKRAKIIYGAQNKIIELETLIDKSFDKKRLLVYCGPTAYTEDLSEEISNESMSQLKQVNTLFANKGMRFAQYTSKENDYQRKEAIKSFKNDTYSTLVAIKCLDEGVNIPQIEKAIILASSTNPREFIQRRGRILRNYPGKPYAEIFDFIVQEERYESLMKKETERLYEFSRIAINKEELLNKFKDLIEKYKLGES